MRWRMQRQTVYFFYIVHLYYVGCGYFLAARRWLLCLLFEPSATMGRVRLVALSAVITTLIVVGVGGFVMWIATPRQATQQQGSAPQQASAASAPSAAASLDASTPSAV